ncbi:hypothetical protein VTK26DRAFT_9304 [Humicola hyalothermophila]
MVKFVIEKAPEPMTQRAYGLCECRLAWANSHYRHDCSPLHIAVCHGHFEIFAWLLRNRCPPLSTSKFNKDERPCTALHDAAACGQLDMMRYILEGGYQTDVQVLDHIDLSPIWHAYYRRQWEPVDLLVELGADVDDGIGCGYSPLMNACITERFIEAVELIDRGANVNVEYHAGPLLVGKGLRPLDTVGERDPTPLFVKSYFRPGLTDMDTGPIRRLGQAPQPGIRSFSSPIQTADCRCHRRLEQSSCSSSTASGGGSSKPPSPHCF